jgi:hypothetical protein
VRLRSRLGADGATIGGLTASRNGAEKRLDDVISEEQAKAIVRSVGKPTLEFAASIVAPLYWAQRGDGGKVTARNGTAFFLRTAEALFGVTAAHVVEGPGGWRESCAQHGKAPLRLGAKNGASVELPWDARCVDIDLDIDIATFAISPREIEAIERVPYGGLQTKWPPAPPRINVGITYAGFPGVGTRNLSREAVQFGILCGTGLVSSLNDREVSTLLEREYLEPVLGEGIVPEDYNFGGISGGPLIYNVLTAQGLLVNALAGVIISGPNPSPDHEESIPGFELFQARRVDFIRADGFLDRDLWDARRNP